MPDSAAVTGLPTLGYVGVPAGPGLVGLVAYVTSLQFAFMLLADLLSALAFTGKVAHV